MTIFIKAVSTALVACILCLCIPKNNKEFSVLVALLATCLIGAAVFQFMQPIFSFIDKITALSKLDTDFIGILLKSVGIGILAEFTAVICADAGNASMGKLTQLLASAAILWLSIPLFENMIDLIDHILSAG